MTTAVKGLMMKKTYLLLRSGPPYDYSSQGTDDEEDLASSALMSPL